MSEIDKQLDFCCHLHTMVEFSGYKHHVKDFSEAFSKYVRMIGGEDLKADELNILFPS